MLRASTSAIRIASPILQRQTTLASPTAVRRHMASGTKKKVSKASEYPKTPSPSPAKVEAPVIDKGDTYKAGEEFFSHNTYSYYDYENKMAPQRCEQPCAEKMKLHCLDKLNPEEEEDPRRLLIKDYGYLEEYPGKVVPVKADRPPAPVMRRKYDLGEKTMDAEDDYRARMPL